MAEYLSPGVYVEEVDTGPKPISGVSTSTAGFVGMTLRGPVTGLPVLVTSFADFRRRFGGYLGEEWGDDRFLAHAVKGFFDNQGQRAFIRRVVGEGAESSVRDLSTGVVHRLAANVLRTAGRARLSSLVGISVGTTLTFHQMVGGADQVSTVTVEAYDPATRLVTWSGPPLAIDYAADSAWVVVQGLGAPTLRIRARDPGAWGDDVSVRVTYTATSRTAVAPLVSLEVGALEDLAFVGGTGPDAGDTTVAIDPPSPRLPAGSTVEVELGNGTETERRTAEVQESGGDWSLVWAEPLEHAHTEVRLLTAGLDGGDTLRLAAAPGGDLDAGHTVRIRGGGRTQVTRVAGVAGAEVTLDDPLEDAYLAGSVLEVVSPAARSGQDRLRVQSARNIPEGALIEIDNGSEKDYRTVLAVDGDVLTLDGNLDHDFVEGNTVALRDFSLHVRYVNEAERIEEEEVFERLTLNPDLPDRYAPTVVTEGSRLVSMAPPEGAGGGPLLLPSTPDGGWMHLMNGDDGTRPADEAYVGVDRGPGDRTGIQSMVDIDQVSIVAVPGKTGQAIQNALIQHCESLMYRFAILDPVQGLGVQDVQAFRNNYDSQYAALYYPWVTVRDPLSGRDLHVPPSGHMAGVYARTDVTRGVHKAPANEVVRGITGLAQTINKREQDILNPSPSNVNVLRDFRSQGRGLRVWGARCVTSDTAWQYVNVRRLFIYLEASLDQGTQWVVFEPNDHRLWARVKQTVTQFLTRVWRDGALMGRTPEEAFFVTVDESTMTQDDIDNGRLIMLVGVAPVKPAEFVIIRIGQWQGGSEMAEL